MNPIKKLFKSLLPPLIQDSLEKYREGRNPFLPRKTWEGTFKTFSDVPIKGGAFTEATWIEGAKKNAEYFLQGKNRRKLRGEPQVNPTPNGISYLVSTLLSVQEKVVVLDFGGSIGSGFVLLRDCLTSTERVDYNIVETPAICAAGTEFFRAESGIRFFSSMQEFPAAQVDLVYVNSALQYIEDLDSLLEQFTRLKPKLIFFERLVIGEIETYVSKQINMPGTEVPHRFLSLTDFEKKMTSLGYQLISHTGSGQNLPQSNFAKEHQIHFSRNLIFRSL